MQIDGVIRGVGIDGCPGGWIASAFNHDKLELHHFINISELYDYYGDACYLIDIPIGLSDLKVSRTIDSELRKILRPVRHHSVFTPPCRPAINKKDYQTALEENRRVTGKGISIQSWNIVPKIREVDNFLRGNKTANSRFYEAHPELCFFRLNGKHLDSSKHSTKGIHERIEILRKYAGSIDELVDKPLPGNARKDDILDSIVLAITARLGIKKGFKFINGESDSEQLLIRLVYF